MSNGMFIHNMLIFKKSSRGKLYVVFVCHRSVSMATVYQLKIKYDSTNFRLKTPGELSSLR